MKVLVSNIQRFCLMDGPGIRTTVFTMGCRYRCPWCCNPENLTRDIKTGINSNKTYGNYIESKELVNLILKDKKYYVDDGGVTFSGGEFLLNIDEYFEVLQELKKLNINICIETSLNAPIENLKKALEYVDFLIIDFKIIDSHNSVEVLKSSSNSFVENFNYLKNNFSSNKYLARIPLAKEIITESNLSMIKDLLISFKPEKIEIFRIHQLAMSKYYDLGMTLNYNFKASDDEVRKIIDFFSGLNISIEEIKI